MQKLIQRILRKIRRGLVLYNVEAKMLLAESSLPEIEDANAFLRQIAPDSGGSCLISRDAGYDVRTLPLSVIIPAYNVETSIQACMESILRQKTSFDYEVIVVNDGSSDGTAAVLKEYGQYPQVRVLHQQNSGVAVARNVGIECAKGEYLCFVDSDDIIPENALESLMTVAVQKCAKLVIGSIQEITSDGTVRHITKLEDRPVRDLKLPGYAWGRVIHYSVFSNLCFTAGYWFEDSIMSQIVHPMCRESTYTISNVCYHYFDNDAGCTSTARGKAKSIDSLWITMRLMKEREAFGLSRDQCEYEYYLSMVALTYQRTKLLGVHAAKCVFVMQCVLMENYYSATQTVADRKHQRIEAALRSKDFRKYILACESRHS